MMRMISNRKAPLKAYQAALFSKSRLRARYFPYPRPTKNGMNTAGYKIYELAPTIVKILLLDCQVLLRSV
jgi:hypothetical protein